MKQNPALLGIWTLLTAGLFGSPQLFEVNAQSMDGWRTNGADRSSWGAQGKLTLPVGAQLSRSFGPGLVTVHLVSQPFFGSDPADCPSLEAGPASVAFVRDNTGGKLVLIVGQGAPMALPTPIPLGEDGRSAQPLDLTLGFDSAGGLATVIVSGQQLPPVSCPASGSAVEVAIAAGTKIDWPLGSFDVVVTTPDSSSASGGATQASASQTSAAQAGSGSGRASATSPTPPPGGPGRLAAAIGGTTAGVASPPAASTKAPATLQVFTPPSVRLRPAALASAHTQPTGTATTK
jgi:hypothetical protein